MPVWLATALVVAGILLVLSGAALIIRTELTQPRMNVASGFWGFLREVVAKGGMGGVLISAGIICLVLGGAGFGIRIDGPAAAPAPTAAPTS